MTVKAKRSKRCDEQQPKFFEEGEPIVKPGPVNNSGVQDLPLEQKYRLSKAFSSEPAPTIQQLSCYEVEMQKQ
jgi:hypothetical protein